jgi:hypothetical protein
MTTTNKQKIALSSLRSQGTAPGEDHFVVGTLCSRSPYTEGGDKETNSNFS